MQLTFSRETDKATANTNRFKENVAPGRARGAVGTLYLLNTDWNELGSPEVISVTIEKQEV